MNHNTIDELAGELLRLYEEACHPFPYTGCRKLLREASKECKDLIPDLDLYFYNIASHCGGVKKLLRWPKEKLLEAQERLGESFFDKHPQYKPLATIITEANTPDLYADLALHERMRRSLLQLLSRLLSERDSFDALHQRSNIPSDSSSILANEKEKTEGHQRT